MLRTLLTAQIMKLMTLPREEEEVDSKVLGMSPGGKPLASRGNGKTPSLKEIPAK